MLKHIETSIPGLLCVGGGLVLFLFGKQSPESLLSAAAIVSAGIGLLRAADARQVKGSSDPAESSKL